MAKFSNVALESITYEEPDEIWSSEKIESLLGPLYERLKLPQGRLELMTGIQERRFWSDPIMPSQASTLAGKKALEEADCGPEEIELLIHSAVCRDRLEPATAAYVHQALGLPHTCQFYDISNACLGFLNAMTVASNMIESGVIKRALIVSGENGKPLVEQTINTLLSKDWTRNEIKPFFANLTIGAGAAAAVLAHSDLVPADRPRIGCSVVRADSSHNHLCQGDTASGNALEMQTDSEALLDAGVALARETWNCLKEESGWIEDTPNRVITHQVGAAHRRRLYEELHLDLEKDYSTFPTFGNIGSVSLPLTLAKGIKEEDVQPDDLITLLGIGSGLSSMMMTLQ